MNDLKPENLSVNFKPGTIDFPQAGELKKLVAGKLDQTKALRRLRHHVPRSTSLKRQLGTFAKSIKRLGTCHLNSLNQRSVGLKKTVTKRHRNSS